MIRVVHVITKLELGGAQENTLYTLGHLDPARFSGLLVAGAGGILAEDARRAAAAGRYEARFLRHLVREIIGIRCVEDAEIRMFRLKDRQLLLSHGREPFGPPVLVHELHPLLRRGRLGRAATAPRHDEAGRHE